MGSHAVNEWYLDGAKAVWRIFARVGAPLVILWAMLTGKVYASYIALQITPVLSQVQGVLEQAGPALSGVLFILAGVFYAIGQMLPPDKKAQFHTTAVNIIIGAVVVGALSFASTSLVTASTHLLSNLTTNSTANSIG